MALKDARALAELLAGAKIEPEGFAFNKNNGAQIIANEEGRPIGAVDTYKKDGKEYGVDAGIKLPKQWKYKTPAELAGSLSVPEFDKAKAARYFNMFGDGTTDEIYEDYAKRKGIKLNPKPLDPEYLKTDEAKQYYGDRTDTYVDQYTNDEDFLKELWEGSHEDIEDYIRDLEENERSKRRNEAYNKYKGMGYDQALSQQKANVDVNYDGDFDKNYPQPGQPDYVPAWLSEFRKNGWK